MSRDRYPLNDAADLTSSHRSDERLPPGCIPRMRLTEQRPRELMRRDRAAWQPQPPRPAPRPAVFVSRRPSGLLRLCVTGEQGPGLDHTGGRLLRFRSQVQLGRTGRGLYRLSATAGSRSGSHRGESSSSVQLEGRRGRFLRISDTERSRSEWITQRSSRSHGATAQAQEPGSADHAKVSDPRPNWVWWGEGDLSCGVSGPAEHRGGIRNTRSDEHVEQFKKVTPQTTNWKEKGTQRL